MEDKLTEELMEVRDFAFTVDAGTVFSKVSQFQFDDPSNYARELVQNAVDSKAKRINVEVDRKHFFIDEEDGTGMTYNDINEYLLKIFSSNKRDDTESIGRFGIGFSSVFATKPKSVIVDTAKDGESWRIVINRVKEGEKDNYKIDFYKGKRTKGTSVLVIKGEQNSILNSTPPEVAKLQNSCKFVKTSVYVNGRKLNQEMKLHDVIYETEINGGAVNGKIGIPVFRKKHLDLYNHGIFLVEKEPAIDFSRYVAIINSNDLKPVLSRNDIYEDEAYRKVVDVLKDSLGKLYMKIAEKYTSAPTGLRLQGNKTQLKNIMLEELLNNHYRLGSAKSNFESFLNQDKSFSDYLADIPHLAALSSSRIFETWDNAEISLDDIMSSYKGRYDRKVYFSKKYIKDRSRLPMVTILKAENPFEQSLLTNLFDQNFVDAQREIENIEEAERISKEKALKAELEKEEWRRREERNRIWKMRKETFRGYVNKTGDAFTSYIFEPVGKVFGSIDDILSEPLSKAKKNIRNSLYGLGKKIPDADVNLHTADIGGKILKDLYYTGSFMKRRKRIIASLALAAATPVAIVTTGVALPVAETAAAVGGGTFAAPYAAIGAYEGGTRLKKKLSEAKETIRNHYEPKTISTIDVVPHEKEFLQTLQKELKKYAQIFDLRMPVLVYGNNINKNRMTHWSWDGYCRLNMDNKFVNNLVKSFAFDKTAVYELLPMIINAMTRDKEEYHSESDLKEKKVREMNIYKFSMAKSLVKEMVETINDDTVDNFIKIFDKDEKGFSYRFRLLGEEDRKNIIKTVYSMPERPADLTKWLESNYENLVVSVGRDMVSSNAYDLKK